MAEAAEGTIVPAAGPVGTPANAFAAAAVAAARAYAADALAPATLRAYAADWRHFCGWCAAAGCAPLPAPPAAVAAYFASLARLYFPRRARPASRRDRPAAPAARPGLGGRRPGDPHHPAGDRSPAR